MSSGDIIGGFSIIEVVGLCSYAVVTHDVGAYEIWVGIPAKFLRRRFDLALSHGIESTRWWEWDHETLKARLPEFNDPASFITSYGSP